MSFLKSKKYCCIAGVTLLVVAGFMFAASLFVTFTLTMISTFPPPQLREHDLLAMQNVGNLAWAFAIVLSVLGGAALLWVFVSAFLLYGAPYSTGAISINAESDSKTKKQK